MDRRNRSALAAALGAAVVATATPAPAAGQPCPLPAPAAVAAAPAHGRAATDRQTLRHVIESRLAQAERAGRRADIEQLGTLWMTLRGRGQLDREVDYGDGYVAAALRNQQRSEHRGQLRIARCVPTEDPALAALADRRGVAWQSCASHGRPDEPLDAAELLDSLEEPYRTAAALAATGMNRREVAEQMGVSHAAVRKWMQRLRDRLAPGR